MKAKQILKNLEWRDFDRVHVYPKTLCGWYDVDFFYSDSDEPMTVNEYINSIKLNGMHRAFELRPGFYFRDKQNGKWMHVKVNDKLNKNPLPTTFLTIPKRVNW